jgi:hypothetical protein
MCLQCGAATGSSRPPCGQCGASIGDVLADSQLGLSDEALLELAREAFAIGTCRRGLTITNFVLQRNAVNEEAASIKTRFIEQLDAQTPFAP